ncbi:MAG: hypothetical protein LUG66_04970 [Clostridiales bacterium]|nr:hypothetical protein [Clostridiales bacterium]
MCYLIAKDIDKVGCYAIETEIGQHLASFKRKLSSEVNIRKIQLVTISRPSAYGEYEPYTFVDTEDEFEKKVKELSDNTL